MTKRFGSKLLLRLPPQMLRSPDSSEHGLRTPRSDIRYWEKTIFQRSRKRASGRRVTAKDWRIQLQHQGRREEFNLQTPNKSVAARLAREISQHLRVNGWKATRAKYKTSSTQQDHLFLERRNKRLALLAEELLNRPTNGNLSRRFWEIVRGIGCTTCGFDRWPAILQFHHIDGNRANQSLANLTVLCPNCHRALHQKIAPKSPPSLRELLASEIEDTDGTANLDEGFVSRPNLARRWNSWRD